GRYPTVRARTRPGASCIGTPHTEAVPRSGKRSPAITLSSVDLPQPFGPIRAANAPRASVNDARRRTGGPARYAKSSPDAVIPSAIQARATAVAPPHEDQEERASEERGDHAGRQRSLPGRLGHHVDDDEERSAPEQAERDEDAVVRTDEKPQ